MKKTNKLISVLLAAIVIFSSVTFVFAASSNDYQNNVRFHKISYSDANSKYNRGDDFIYFFYRDTCGNSKSIGTYVLTKWMNEYSLDIYGQNCDDYPVRPSWMGLSGTITLPVVCFVKNGKVTTYSASDGYQQLEDRISADVLTTFNINDTSVNNYSYTVKYHQTDARAMLSLVNSLRTGGNAWYYDSNNSVLQISGLSALTYDYDLEKSAMQRAAELVVMYSHTRPDNRSCFSAYSNYRSAAENIAYGYKTYSEMETAFEEANRNYSGQGHRRNILNSNVTAVAFACAEYNGVKCWVQEFRNPVGSTTKTSALDGEVKVTAAVANSNIKSSTISVSTNSISMNYGATKQLPIIKVSLSTVDTPRTIGSVSTETSCSWLTSNADIITVSGDNIIAKGVGKANLSAKIGEKSITIPVTVSAAPLSDATVTLSTDRWLFDGSAATPGVLSVKLNGKSLTSNDYTVSYSSNTTVGMGNVIINGKGNYTGSTRKGFEIYCVHSSTGKIPAVAATCTEIGLTEGKGCTICGQVLINQNVIPAKGHIDNNDDGICEVCNKISDLTRYNNLQVKDTVITIPKPTQIRWRYKAKITAYAENMPQGYHLAWFEGDRCISNNEVMTSNSLISVTTFTAKVVDSSGNIASVDEQNQKIEIAVETGFFAKLVSFIMRLFGSDITEIY